jgi:hypothetical protein
MHLCIGHISINATLDLPGGERRIELFDNDAGSGILLDLSELNDLATALQSIHRLAEIGSK